MKAKRAWVLDEFDPEEETPVIVTTSQMLTTASMR
jgi:type I site-specific restriction endonuclease